MKTNENIKDESLQKRHKVKVEIKEEKDSRTVFIEMQNMNFLDIQYLEYCIGDWYHQREKAELKYGVCNKLSLVQHIKELRDELRREITEKLVPFPIKEIWKGYEND